MTKNPPEKRDNVLTVLLVLILLGNAIFVIGHLLEDAFFFFLPISPIYFFFVGIPVWAIPLFIIYSIVSICSVIALFAYRKVGFYVFCLSTVAGFITSMASGVLTFGVIVNCATTVILAILLRAEWNLYR